MTAYKNINELKTDLADILTFHDPKVTIHKPERIHTKTIDKLVYTVVFASDESLKAKCRKLIHSIAKETGSISSSIRPLYQAYAEGKVGGFTVPAINIRMITYDTARAIFRKAKQHDVGAFIIEIARTEADYTGQLPDEFATVVLAAAIKEQYKSPVFIQGDHCQFSAWRYKDNKDVEIKRVQDWVSLCIEAGFYNIDIDGSTLVDLSKPSLHAQQKDNADVTAIMTKFIREKEKEKEIMRVNGTKGQNDKIKTSNDKISDSLTLRNSDPYIAIGGEIGHIGDKNSTAEDFEAFMKQYINKIAKGSGISKVSVQTGTSHGGVVNPDGTVQKMEVDFSVLENVGKVAREKYRIAGTVQHGASTLQTKLYNKFVDADTTEVHLSTGFQNIVFDTMPKDLRTKMYDWLKKECKKEWKEGWTEEQFIYKTRKKVWGPFKKKLWDLTEKEKKPIVAALEEYIETIFTKLNVADTKEIVEKYI